MKLIYKRNGNEYASDEAMNDLVTDETLKGAVSVLAIHLGIVPASVEYLLQYGWAQSLQDSIAGREKKVRDELPDATGDEIAKAVAEDLDGTLSKRMDAIREGTLRERANESRDVLRGIAIEYVKQVLKTKGRTKVKKEKIQDLVNQILADPEKRAKVQIAYDKRKAEEEAWAKQESAMAQETLEFLENQS